MNRPWRKKSCQCGAEERSCKQRMGDTMLTSFGGRGKKERKKEAEEKSLFVEWKTWRQVSRSAWLGDLRSGNSDLHTYWRSWKESKKKTRNKEQVQGEYAHWGDVHYPTNFGPGWSTNWGRFLPCPNWAGRRMPVSISLGSHSASLYVGSSLFPGRLYFFGAHGIQRQRIYARTTIAIVKIYGQLFQWMLNMESLISALRKKAIMGQSKYIF